MTGDWRLGTGDWENHYTFIYAHLLTKNNDDFNYIKARSAVQCRSED
jgi:hypothetical protein